MQIFRYGKYDNQIDIIPYLTIYFHSHSFEKSYKEYPWHFHISIQWIIWYFEIQIGKDYKGE
jgi:hypothetical protein